MSANKKHSSKLDVDTYYVASLQVTLLTGITFPWTIYTALARTDNKSTILLIVSSWIFQTLSLEYPHKMCNCDTGGFFQPDLWAVRRHCVQPTWSAVCDIPTLHKCRAILEAARTQEHRSGASHPCTWGADSHRLDALLAFDSDSRARLESCVTHSCSVLLRFAGDQSLSRLEPPKPTSH